MNEAVSHRDQILGYSRQAYQDLQSWWQLLSRSLPDHKLLCQIAEHNYSDDVIASTFRRASPTTILLETEFSEIAGPLFNRPVRTFDTAILYRVTPECNFTHNFGVYSLYFLPLNKRHVARDQDCEYVRLAAGYPFHHLSLTLGEGMDQLRSLDVRLRSSRPTENVRTLQISLDSNSVWTIVQTARDNTYFKNPLDHQLQDRAPSHRPSQRFSYQHLAYEHLCSFGYDRSNYLRMSSWQDLLFPNKFYSFCPYPGFNVGEAIIRACHFQSAIKPAP
ncbi:MAG: hypothetical protein M1607_03595 [Patescibacteria group bacterium]|nr:hypothetical protein [Patescibacteria group bacterium]